MAVINLPTMEQFDEMNDYLAIMATHIGTDKIGTQTYTDNNYVTDGQSVTASIDALDIAVKNNAEQISTNVGDLEAHINDKDNPHEVTAAQVGALSTTDAGDLAELTTTEKGSLVGAINEVDMSLNEVKDLVDTNKAETNLKIATVEKDLNDFERVITSLNPNQEPKQKVNGYDIIPLPKNAANGQVSVGVKGETITNLLGSDGDFEDLTKWSLRTSSTGGTSELSQDKKLFGSNSLQFNNTGGNFYRYMDITGLDNTKYYELSVYCNIESAEEGAYFSLLHYDYNGFLNYKISRADITKLNQWQRLKLKFTGKDGIRVAVGNGVGTTGIAYFDGMMLREISQEEYNDANNITPEFINGTKSTNSVRIRSVNEDETKESIAYVNLPQGEELRSLPNGVKDEVSLIEQKLIKRVSDEYTINSDLISSITTRAYQEKATAFSLTLNIDNTVPSETTYIYDNAYIVQKGIKFSPQSGWGPGSTHWDKDFPQYCIFPELEDGRMRLTVSLPHTMTGWEGSPTLQQIRGYFNANPATLNYQLAEPVEIPIQTSGSLVSYPSGTVYIEPYVADAGIYTDKMEVLYSDLPIKALEKISKVDFDTGLETELDVSAAEILEDKKSFTHPDLVEGDIVFFVYEHGAEGTIPETEISYYDSRYVIKGEDDKFYQWEIEAKLVEGVITPSIKLVEV